MSAHTKPIVDRLAVTLFAILFAATLHRFGPAIASGASVSACVLGLIAGYLLADGIAGTVHWIADRYFDPRTPLLGPMLIEPFREHHEDALSITRHDFFEVSGNNALVVCPVLAALLLAPEPAGPIGHFAVATALFASLSLFATNLFHSWAHAPRPPRIARRLQRWGLILRPQAHARHHRHGHDRAYCVTSGWLNPVLDRLRLFERAEQLLASIGTRRPPTGRARRAR